jgi:hypothetical protein
VISGEGRDGSNSGRGGTGADQRPANEKGLERGMGVLEVGMGRAAQVALGGVGAGGEPSLEVE